MTVLQYCILIYLEKKNRLKISDLAGLFDVDQSVVLNDLNALLIVPSLKNKTTAEGILNTNLANGKELSGNEEVWINMDFNPNTLKISAVPVVFKRTKTEIEVNAEKDKEMLQKYQNSIIDAYVTRIMKGRIGQKTTHLELVNETAKQIELFQAQPVQIKSRIEALIEKEILKRKDGFYDQYEYIS